MASVGSNFNDFLENQPTMIIIPAV